MKRPAELLAQPGWWRYDPALVTICAALVSLGLVMVYSASVAVAVEVHQNETYFFEHQIVYFLLGAVALVALSRLPYQRLAIAGKPLYAATLLLLAVVLLLGHNAGGAKRWIQVPALGQVQPSEFMKVALILVLSGLYARDLRRAREFKRGFLHCTALVALPVALIIAEPDLGTSIIVASTGFAVFFAGGASLLQLPLLIGTAGGLVAMLIKISPYRFSRFSTFLHPLAIQNAQGVAYQVQQALIALGSGGIFGRGLGASRQKFSYVPAPHTDSIFAIVGEELGYVGCVAVILLFIALAWRGLTIARDAPDQFGALVATGITCSLVVQAFINIAAVSSSIPFTGVPLPFISYGGSSLIVSLAAIGILLNIGSQAVPNAVAAAERPASRIPVQRPVATPAAPDGPQKRPAGPRFPRGRSPMKQAPTSRFREVRED
jgi:cell division protein FtsW